MREPYRLWTATEDNQLQQLIEQGLPRDKIVALMPGRTIHAVADRAAKLDLCIASRNPSKWTPEMDATLMRMRDEGKSFGIIADFIGNGITRRACIGRAYRLDLPRIKQPTLSKITERKDRRHERGLAFRAVKRKQVRAKITAVMELPITQYFRGISLLDLEHDQCRYPQGDSPNILFCGQPVVEGTSWCAHCSKIVYDTARTERSDRKFAEAA